MIARPRIPPLSDQERGQADGGRVSDNPTSTGPRRADDGSAAPQPGESPDPDAQEPQPPSGQPAAIDVADSRPIRTRCSTAAETTSRGQPGAPPDVVEGVRAGGEGVEHRAQRGGAHVNSRPIWNTATARTHATPSCRPMPNAVQRTPISLRCAANVATHGV